MLRTYFVFTSLSAQPLPCTKSGPLASIRQHRAQCNLVMDTIGTRGLMIAKALRAAIFVVCFLTAGSAFAAGGACPTGSYVPSTNPATPTAFTSLSSLGVTSCYYVAANGSDSNNGTTESTPWLHAPGMVNCSANCAALTPGGASPPAGTGFIFRGGDTWHFGITTDSAGQPASGSSMSWNNNNVQWGGTAAHPLYVGYDPTWFTGGSFVRPIFTGDNPICNVNVLSGTCTLIAQSPTWTRSGLEVQVSSCLHQVVPNPSALGGNNQILTLSNVHFVIVDNFELTGLCLNSNDGSEGGVYISYGSLSNTLWIFNTYVHGWSHIQWSANAYPPEGGGAGCVNGAVCTLISGYAGSGNVGQGDILRYNVMDGSDSDPIGAGIGITGFQEAEYNIFRYQCQFLTRGQTHVFHDNIIEWLWDNGHSNVAEMGDQPTGVNAFYRNIFRNNGTTGAGPQGVFIAHAVVASPSDYTTYFFDNLIYNSTGEVIGAGDGDAPPPQNAGLGVMFNNTIEFVVGSSILGCAPATNMSPVTLVNNHWIDDISPYSANCMAQFTAPPLTDLVQTHAQSDANTAPHFDQYVNAQTSRSGSPNQPPYANSPVASTNSTVATGTNETSGFCATIATAAMSDSALTDAANACKFGTSYALSYNATTHTVSIPSLTPVARPASAVWDKGAYQFSASLASQTSQGQAPQAPTNLQITVQ